jgi:3-phosphoglycerate kinase
MAFTFKKTLDGMDIGKSLFDQAGSEKVAGLLEKAKKNNVKVVFPVDYVTGSKFDKDAEVSICGIILKRMAKGLVDWYCY